MTAGIRHRARRVSAIEKRTGITDLNMRRLKELDQRLGELQREEQEVRRELDEIVEMKEIIRRDIDEWIQGLPADVDVTDFMRQVDFRHY
jgi:hypothetical protein